MKDFKTKLYCYDHESGNVEFESDDEIHIDIKDKTVVLESDNEVTVQNTKRRKIPIVTTISPKRGNLTLEKGREKRELR